MKNKLFYLFSLTAVALLLGSCGTQSRVSTLTQDDGIYFKRDKEARAKEISARIAQRELDNMSDRLSTYLYRDEDGNLRMADGVTYEQLLKKFDGPEYVYVHDYNWWYGDPWYNPWWGSWRNPYYWSWGGAFYGSHYLAGWWYNDPWYWSYPYYGYYTPYSPYGPYNPFYYGGYWSHPIDPGFSVRPTERVAYGKRTPSRSGSMYRSTGSYSGSRGSYNSSGVYTGSRTSTSSSGYTRTTGGSRSSSYTTKSGSSTSSSNSYNRTSRSSSYSGSSSRNSSYSGSSSGGRSGGGRSSGGGSHSSGGSHSGGGRR